MDPYGEAGFPEGAPPLHAGPGHPSHRSDGTHPPKSFEVLYPGVYVSKRKPKRMTHSSSATSMDSWCSDLDSTPTTESPSILPDDFQAQNARRMSEEARVLEEAYERPTFPGHRPLPAAQRLAHSPVTSPHSSHPASPLGYPTPAASLPHLLEPRGGFRRESLTFSPEPTEPAAFGRGPFYPVDPPSRPPPPPYAPPSLQLPPTASTPAAAFPLPGADYSWDAGSPTEAQQSRPLPRPPPTPTQSSAVPPIIPPPDMQEATAMLQSMPPEAFMTLMNLALGNSVGGPGMAALKQQAQAIVPGSNPSARRGAGRGQRMAIPAAAPTVEDKSAVDPRKYKTRICRNWEDNGHCPYEHTCCFAHGPHEVRTVTDNHKMLASIGYFSNVFLLAMTNGQKPALPPHCLYQQPALFKTPETAEQLKQCTAALPNGVSFPFQEPMSSAYKELKGDKKGAEGRRRNRRKRRGPEGDFEASGLTGASVTALPVTTEGEEE